MCAVGSSVERLIRQARGSSAINGQCTVANLKRLLQAHGLMASGPKAELIQRVYNYKDTIRILLGLEVEVVQGDEGDAEREEGDDDVVVVCCVLLEW